MDTSRLLGALDAQIAKTEASILDSNELQNGATTEYQDQAEALDELKRERAEA